MADLTSISTAELKKELAKRAQNYPISTILIEKQIINNNYVNNNVSPKMIQKEVNVVINNIPNMIYVLSKVMMVVVVVVLVVNFKN